MKLFVNENIPIVYKTKYLSFLYPELDEIKQQIESTVANEEIRTQIKRAISRTRSESNSDTASVTGSTMKMAENEDGLSQRSSLRGSIRRRSSEQKSLMEVQKDNKLIEKEKAETGSVKWDVYKHYLKSIGVSLSVLTVVFNLIFQGFSIGSNIWLSKWSSDEKAGNDTSLRDMYLGVYGAFGAGQGMFVVVHMIQLNTK